MAWAQEGAISSMTTMSVIAGTILALRGIEAGAFALVALAIVILRHSPNIRQLFSKK
jgi:glycerol-3-phosphate acyltransferase PlsY